MEGVSTTQSSHPARHATRAEQLDDASPQRLLGRRLACRVSPHGTGSLELDGIAVTRWNDDSTIDRDGSFLYLRDVEDGTFWSATHQPTGIAAERYEFEAQPGRVSFRRADRGIQSELDVCVCPESDIEYRRCRLTNLSSRTRTIEVTSYLEWVLQDGAADASHPAFSKLFVETEFMPQLAAIVARRRRRDPHQTILNGAHWIATVQGNTDGRAAAFEANRMAFIGRGATLAAPRAMTVAAADSPAGQQGPVLDPIASLRTLFLLGPNESASIVFATTARRDDEALTPLNSALSPEEVDVAFLRAEEFARRGAIYAGAEQMKTRPGELAAVEHESESLRVDRAHRRPSSPAQNVYRRLVAPMTTSADRVAINPGDALQFDNGIGGFSASGDEYVIRLRRDADGRLTLPPLPWSHVVANPNAGFIATETGAGSSWTINSRENRLTHWSNDPVSDPHSEAIYLREDAQRSFWSTTAGPADSGAEHEIRYGFGYVEYSQQCADLEQRLLQFVPTEHQVKISRLRLHNHSSESREFDVFAYAHLALGNGTRTDRGSIRTWFDEASGALFAANSQRLLANRVTFAALICPTVPGDATFTCDRAEFIGQWRDLAMPRALGAEDQLSGRSGAGLDPCFALQRTIQVEGHGDAECWVLLGEADNAAEARWLISRYSAATSLDAAFAEVTENWRRTLSVVQIETPSPAINVMVNGWLPYQNISCRLWGRSAYYQSGGAYGFRDQLQDAAALIYHDPAITRTQILRHAASQFVEGDVLHWWHPPDNRGMRTRFADDLLWLPLLVCEYVATTGDAAVWEEQAPFVDGPALDSNEAERYLVPQRSHVAATVYEHCCLAIDRSLKVGAHGLPLMGCGDWNDGMSRIGQGGRGESVWMGFFLCEVLRRMTPVCEARGDHARVERYRARQRQLREALNGEGWDGQWFRRAFFDDGTPVGSAGSSECQIDALVQAWAVLSGAGDDAKARQGVAAVERRLVDERAGLIRLLDPPFDKLDHDPGYIMGYVPGVRENGGQYTHGVLWFIRAMAELGRGSRAVELLEMLNPINHARTASGVAVYQAEPYVVAADVYSQPPHVGRAGWTWYTGSAGWMWRVAVESVLGLQVVGGRELRLNPCISAAWSSCRFRYRLADGATYHVEINNPHGKERGVTAATVDGTAAVVEGGVAVVPLTCDGAEHRVVVTL
jgi:N,N'-diacetylchitobiose phosphorylase